MRRTIRGRSRSEDDQRTSFLEQIMLLRGGTEDSKPTYLLSILHSGNFLDVLKKEESIIRVKILQNQGGHQPPPQRRRYADCNQRILQILDDYPNRQTLNYLRSIAHNLSF